MENPINDESPREIEEENDDSLPHRLETIRDRQTALQSQIESLTNQEATLHSKLNQLIRQRDEVDARKNELANQRWWFWFRRHAKKAQMEALDAQRNSLNSSIEKTNFQLCTLTAQLASLRAEIDSLHTSQWPHDGNETPNLDCHVFNKHSKAQISNQIRAAEPPAPTESSLQAFSLRSYFQLRRPLPSLSRSAGPFQE